MEIPTPTAPSPVRVRDLVSDDLPAVHALNQANVPAVGEATFEHLQHLVRQSLHALVAEVNGGPDDEPDDGPDGAAGDGTGSSVAGFCLVLAPGADYGSVNYQWFSQRYDQFVYLDRIAVDEQVRGRRVGAALYAEVERRCAGRAWFTLEVNLRPRNDVSLAFHDRLGFTEVGRQETPYGFLVSLQAKPL